MSEGVIRVEKVDENNILFSLSMIGVLDPTRVLPILVLSVCCAA